MAEAQPPKSRLMRVDLWILIVLGILGITFFLLKFDESFPAASIDLRMPKSQIIKLARNWSEKVGYPTTGAIDSTIFSFDEDAKTFLEYELGQGKANDLMKDEVPVWTWRSRFCRPLQQEECAIGMRTNGTLGFFERTLPNDVKLPSISHAEAKKLAESFVKETVGGSLYDTKLIDDSEEKQVNRADHYFTWEDQGHDFKGGRLRTYVYISGNSVTQFNKYLHVPEKFERKYAEIRSWNELLKSISSIIYVILSSAIIFIFIWAFANGKIRWKLALFAGGGAALLSVLSWVDSWPSVVAAYQTTTPFNQYLTESAIGMAVGAVFAAIASAVFIGALEPVYRSMFPKQIAIESLMTVNGLRSSSVFRGLVAGLAVFGIHTAYVVAFYLIGQKIGFWSPLEVRDTATLSGVIPVYEAINVGVIASTTEELMYRVLALAVFQRLTKNFWLSNFLQAASWAFMHSDYPQEPAYARGVELTIGGFFYGWVLRQFGLLACVLAHYTYDAFLGVTPLIVSAVMSDRLTAMIAIAPGIVALAVGSWLIWRKGLLKDESAIVNEAVVSSKTPPPLQSIVAVQYITYNPLQGKFRVAVVAVALVLLLVSGFVKSRVVGQNNQIKMSRDQATRLAASYLLENGIDIKGMKSVAWMTDATDETELQYVYEKEGYAKTKKLAISIEPRLLWRVRFFKELEPTEYYATITSEGKPHARFVVKEEDASGSKLEPDQAKELAKNFIEKEHPELGATEFDDATRHDRKDRSDYDIEYRIPGLKAGNAEYKVYTGTVGGDVSGYSRGWQVPDDWTYQRNKVSQKDQIFNIIRRVMAAAMALFCLWWLYGILHSHMIRWKPAIVIGCVSATTALIGYANSIPTLFVGYATTGATQTFLLQQLVQYTIGALSAAGSATLVSAFAYGAFRKMYPDLTFGSLIRPLLPKGLGGSGSDRRMWLDAIVIAYAGGAIAATVDHLFDVGQFLTSPAVHLFSLGSIRGVADEWSPAIGALAAGVTGAIMLPIAVMLLVSLIDKYAGKSFWKALLLMFVITAVMYSSARYYQDYLWHVVSMMVMSAMVYFAVVKVARLNILAYVLTGYITALAGVAFGIVRSGYELYFPHLAVIFVALLAPLAYLLWLYLPFSKRKSVPASNQAVSG